MLSYRGEFQPSEWRTEPHAILTVAIICADTDAEAERLASSADLNVLRRARGEYGPLPSPEEALAYDYSVAERDAIRRNRQRLFVGSPQTLRGLLQPLIAQTRPDELMVTAAIFYCVAEGGSYELLAQEFDVGAA